MPNSPIYRQVKRLAQRKIAGELFVVDPAHRCLHQPQGAAETIWEGLAHGAREEDLVRRLLEEYEVNPPQAEKDVARLLRELKRKKLIEQVGP